MSLNLSLLVINASNRTTLAILDEKAEDVEETSTDKNVDNDVELKEEKVLESKNSFN